MATDTASNLSIIIVTWNGDDLTMKHNPRKVFATKEAMPMFKALKI